MMRFPVLSLLLINFSRSAAAHPGHGTPDADVVMHYISSPVHLGPTLFFFMAIGCVVITLTGLRRRRRRYAPAERPSGKS